MEMKFKAVIYNYPVMTLFTYTPRSNPDLKVESN